LFKKGGSKIGFGSVDDALDFELDSHYWRSVYARKFPERTFTTLEMSSSDLEESSDDDIVRETILEQNEDDRLDSEDEDFDVDDFDFAEGAPNDIFDLPEKSVGVHVGTRIEVSKKSFKKMLINSQLNILQALVRDVLQRWVGRFSDEFGESIPYHVLNLIAPYSHDILAKGYEEYNGFKMRSFKEEKDSQESKDKRSRFNHTLIVYAMSSSFPDRMVKKDMPSFKDIFYEAVDSFLMEFDLDLTIPEDKKEIYRLQHSTRRSERVRR